MAINRISGKMLQDNLLRNGANLAVETNLLYIDVVNDRIGINNSSPTVTLDVTGVLKVSGNGTIDDLTIAANAITSNSGDLVLDSTAGDISVNNNKITDCIDPTDNLDVVNKQYLTSVVGSIQQDKIIAGDSSLTVIDTATGTFDFVLDTISVAQMSSSVFNLTPDITTAGEITALTADIGDLNFDNATITSDTGTINISSLLKLTGAGSNRILYTVSSVLTGSLNFKYDGTTFTVNGVAVVDDLTLDGSTITSANSITLTTTSDGDLTINTDAGVINITSTSAVKMPAGTTAERPTGVAGMQRWNSTTGEPEFYDGADWQGIKKEFNVTSQQIVPDVISAGAFVIGFSYIIVTTGTTDYTLIGAANSLPGTIFTATGAGTGDGTASAFDFALNKSATTDGILLAINGILQDPEGAAVYSVSSTTLTMTSVLPNTDIISIRFLEY